MSVVRLIRGAEGAPDQAAVERVIAQSLARAGQDELGCPLRLADLRQQRRGLAEIVETLPEPALILILDDKAGEGMAAAVIDGALMAGMVEAMATGTVTPGDGAARRPTRTDAALLAPVMDHALSVLEAAATEAGLAALSRGFRFASVADGGRALSLLLEDGFYRLLIAEVDLAAGARKGQVWLALPEQRPSAIPQVADSASLRFRAELQAQVEGAQVRLEAVLQRLMLPLGQVMALQVGQSLPLPRADVGRIALEGLDGRQIATARLGRHGSLRALRLVADGGEAAAPRPIGLDAGVEVRGRAGPLG